MRSLKGRLWLLWAMILAASVVVGLLLHQLYRTSTAAEVQRGEAVAARGCDLLRDRYQFWARGWDGSEFSAADPELVRDLRSVILSAVYGQRDLRAGIWSSEAGMLADVGAAPPDKGQDLSRLSDALTALNQLAARTEQTVTDLVEVREATVALAACPLTGPVSGLTGWVSNRIEGADDADPLRFGVGVLFLLVLGIGGWLLWLTTSWARRVGRIEAALAGGALEDWPVLSATGERELDRIVAALNDAGSRLAAARRRSEVLAGRVAQSERLASLGRVAAGVAHEIRNPMAALRLKAENALAGDDERRRRALEASLLQISRIDRLLTELLAMGRRAPPNPRWTSLESFLNSVVEEHREAARAKNIEVLCAASAMEATIDPELVRRILDNLLTNARQHTPPGGTIRVTAVDVVADAVPAVEIAVTDNGPGVASEIAGRLFEPFATGRPDGTGLGLAIARELAEAHGGRLEHRPGESGATFVLTLPRTPREGRAAVEGIAT